MLPVDFAWGTYIYELADTARENCAAACLPSGQLGRSLSDEELSQLLIRIERDDFLNETSQTLRAQSFDILHDKGTLVRLPANSLA